MERLGSGESGAILAAMDNSGHKNKRNHMRGPSTHVYLYHKPQPYNLFNLMMIEEFSRGIWKE